MGRRRTRPLPSAPQAAQSALRSLCKAHAGNPRARILCPQLVAQIDNVGLRRSEGNLAAVAFLGGRIALGLARLSEAVNG
jgi:hypothetical protein